MTTETSITDLVKSTGKLTDEVVQKYTLLEQRLQTAITDFENRAPVGMPMPWPVVTPPQGWLSCNGAPFDKLKYRKLAELYTSGYLPDLRGEFIRGWDGGRDVDAGRELLSAQGDTIRNIVGEQSLSVPYNGKSTGVFYNTGKNSNEGIYDDGTKINDAPGVGGLAGMAAASGERIYFNASRVVPTASENRPRNIAFHYIMRAE